MTPTPLPVDTVSAPDLLPTNTSGLAAASSSHPVRLRDGGRFNLTVTAVRKRVAGDELRMLAYNGTIPGPTLLVDQGAEVTIHAANRGDIETTVHWHGIRLANSSDGVPGATQTPIPVGGTFDYTLQFLDPGIYWYHPHIREDFAQELGLYGVIVVEPTDPAYWPPSDRQLTLTLDDLLIEGGRVAPFHPTEPSHTLMGRFGNTLLINGDTSFHTHAHVGQVTRLFVVNTANTRLFNLALPGTRMKLVGGDSGRYEHETFVDTVMLAPSERAVVDLYFDRAGDMPLQHRTPHRTYPLGSITVNAGDAATAAAATFSARRINPELIAQRQLAEQDMNRVPDKMLAFSSQMLTNAPGDQEPEAPAEPSHIYPLPRATQVRPHSPVNVDGSSAPTHTRQRDSPLHHHHAHTSQLEWEDAMPAMNRASNRATMAWKIIDRDTGAVNTAIDWAFRVGDRIKIRLLNETDQDHPMQHPFHIHGAGRFLILSRDGVPEPNLVWKDTVLVATGQTVDILLEVSNPGLWMAHCHIAEHNESHMMFSFTVSPSAARLPRSVGDRVQPDGAHAQRSGVTP